MTASILGLQATESESETVKQVNSGLGGHPLLTESTSRLGVCSPDSTGAGNMLQGSAGQE